MACIVSCTIRAWPTAVCDRSSRLPRAKALSINEIRHVMDKLHTVFDAFRLGPNLEAVARDFGLAQPQV